MSDGGYSRLEKDFLGNERMVHYDGSGNMLGASDVVREPDGTVRINNEATPTYQADELPHVEAVVPQPKPSTHNPPITEPKPSMPMSQTVMYALATFILGSLLTLVVLRTRGGSDDARIQSTPQFTPNRSSQAVPNSTPGPSNQENFPDNPKPRNDEQPNEPKPFDQGAPDSNMDDNHPRIRDNNGEPDTKPEAKPKKGPDDPIDLRGDDGDKKKGPTGDDPIKGDDIH